MHTEPDKQPEVPKHLGEGLVLRQATRADSDNLVAFNVDVFGGSEGKEIGRKIGMWTRDLMTGSHPTTEASDFTLVEDTETGKIVSSLCLISQTWSYGGIEFGVGRPEIIGTHPDYRKRGLVRAQMELVHAWSAARGQRVQAITGIPWFYRMFGYEMALALGGGRTGYSALIPELEDEQEETYHIRNAKSDDIPFIFATNAHGLERNLVACIRDERAWEYELAGRSADSVEMRKVCILENPNGGAIGFFLHPTTLWKRAIFVSSFDLAPGVSWMDVMPTVVRYLRTTGEDYAKQPGSEAFETYAFWLGGDHPLYHAYPDLLPRKRTPYAYYIRVPDLPGFIMHIRPVLEERLAQSAVAGHSGELKLNFYREGWALVFENGALQAVEPWQVGAEDGDALFPGLTFLQLLFGYRSLGELDFAFPDCYPLTNTARALLPALFPKQTSHVWPLG